MLIRQPGKHVFWVVQWKNRANSEYSVWQEIGSHQIVKVPNCKRKSLSGYMGPEQEPFREWSSCGKVWQDTRNNGFYKHEDAALMLELLVQNCDELQFRAIEVELEMKMLRIITQ